jgi:hypothetical protein
MRSVTLYRCPLAAWPSAAASSPTAAAATACAPRRWVTRRRRSGPAAPSLMPCLPPSPSRSAPPQVAGNFLSFKDMRSMCVMCQTGAYSGQCRGMLTTCNRELTRLQALRRVTVLCRRAAATAHDVQLLQDARHAPVALWPRRPPHPVQCVSALEHPCSWHTWRTVAVASSRLLALRPVVYLSGFSQ